MFCRYFLFLFLFLNVMLCWADSGRSAWNCDKNEKGEWQCVTGPETSPAQELTTEQVPAQEFSSESTPVVPMPVAPLEQAQGQVEDSKTTASETLKPEPVLEQSLNIEEQFPAAPMAENSQSMPLPIPEIAQVQQSVDERPGWTCNSNPENETWNCNLVGNDPKGQARIMNEDEGKFRIIPPAFDGEQEQTFNNLQADLKYDPWKSCTLALGAAPDFISQKSVRDEAPMDIGADYTEIFDREIASFMGNVHMTHADQSISANMASYDTVSKTMDLQGNVYYSEEDFSLFSDTAMMDLGSDQARLRNTLFISPTTPLRGSATAIYRENRILTHLKEVAFTSCAPSNQDWVMHSSRLKLNKETGRGSAKHTWLEFKGLPVLYLPYVSFPLDNRRQSGLLTPGFGSTESGGFDFRVPYYWNIAPNYDATLWGRYLTKRGAMLGGEFRYLTKRMNGSVEAEVLPYDFELDKTRWQGSFKNHTWFTENLRANIDLNYVSDEEYFDDLGDSLQIVTNRYLYSVVDLFYNRPGVDFSAKADNYQSIDNTIPDEDRPYRRLPQLLLNLQHSADFMPLDMAMHNEFVYFQHNDRVEGQRLNVQPSFSFPYKQPGFFITPKVSAQYTQYWLQNQQPGKSDNITRVLPIASIDSGLFFEREYAAHVHTIEPRLFYLYIPEKNQDDIPLFDTSLYDFTFDQMFRENRYNGIDRMADANQLTAAVTSRLIDSNSGVERLTFSIGNIFYFQDRNVGLVSGPPETRSFSNVIAEFNGHITDTISFRSGLQYNPDDNSIDRADAALRYRNEYNQIVNLGYRFRQNSIESLGQNDINQSDVSFRLPLYDSWHIVGRWQYSILHSTTLESFLGFEKESCCWRFRIIGRRFIKNINSLQTAITGEGELENGFFIQLELKGLANFGDKVQDFLQDQIGGYRPPER